MFFTLICFQCAEFAQLAAYAAAHTERGVDDGLAVLDADRGTAQTHAGLAAHTLVAVHDERGSGLHIF